MNYFYLILLVSGLATLALSAVLFQKNNPVTKSFAGIMLTISLWAIAYSIELTQNTLHNMLFWIRIEYLGIGFLPACWILFVFNYTDAKHLLKNKYLIPIFTFSLTTVFMVWTNGFHKLHYSEVGIDTSGPTPLLSISQGIWYWIHTVFFYGMLLWGILLIMLKFKKADKLYKRQTLFIVVGAMIPWIINLVYLSGIRPYQHIDLTPYGFVATAILISIGLFRFELFSIVPQGRNKVLGLMHEGFVILDYKNRILDANDTMLRILDLRSRSEFLNENFFYLWPEKQLFKAINLRRSDKILLEKTNGDNINYYEVSINPFDSVHDKEKGTLLLFWDVTRHKQDAQRLSSQASHLEELNSLKNKLISIISHDLRSPMASLKQMLDMIGQQIITEKHFNSLLPKLSHNLRYTTDLLDNLLHWSKNQLEGAKVEVEVFNISETIHKNISLMEGTAENKSIKLSYTGDETSLVYADKNMVDLVVRNLLNNAIKFSKAGSEINICLMQKEESYEISVADQGLGMSGEVLQQLFKYSNISKNGTQNEKGTGIGLMLCKDFVEKNGGSIWAESEVNRGSTFYFTVPMATLNMVAELMN